MYNFRKRALSMLLGVIVVTALSVSAMANTYLGTIKGSGVNIRLGPSISYISLGWLDYGDSWWSQDNSSSMTPYYPGAGSYRQIQMSSGGNINMIGYVEVSYLQVTNSYYGSIKPVETDESVNAEIYR